VILQIALLRKFAARKFGGRRPHEQAYRLVL
jgi:hypothetical protein